MQLLTKEAQHQLRLAWLKNAMHVPPRNDYDNAFLQLQFAIAAAQSNDKMFDALGRVFSDLEDLSPNSQQPLLFALAYLAMSVSDLQEARQEKKLLRKTENRLSRSDPRRLSSTTPNCP